LVDLHDQLLLVVVITHCRCVIASFCSKDRAIPHLYKKLLTVVVDIVVFNLV